MFVPKEILVETFSKQNGLYLLKALLVFILFKLLIFKKEPDLGDGCQLAPSTVEMRGEREARANT